NGGPPDHFYCALGSQCLAVWAAMKAAGYKGIFWTGLYSDALTKILGGTISWGFYNEAPNAGLTQMKDDLSAVGGLAKLDNWSASAYFSTDMFIAALKKAAAKGKSNITPEAVQKAAATTTWQIKGLVGPMTYPAASVLPTPSCISLVV